MKWFSWRRESRADESNYSSQILDSLQQQASVQSADAIETAAAEIAAGIIGRAFAAGQVEGDRFKVITPAVLMLSGREMIRQGEMIFALDGPPLRLTPCGSWNVHGESDPATWFYRIDDFGPDSTRTRWLPGETVVHFRHNCPAQRPYEGRSPFRIARLTAESAAAAEKSAAKEFSLPTGRLVPAPGTEAQLGDFAQTLRKGGVIVPRSGADANMAGRQDSSNAWKPNRLGPELDPQHVELRRAALLDLLTSAGVSPVLADSRADGGSRREAFRQLLHSTVQPMAKIVERELSEKLETPITISFRSLAAGDTAGRTRSVKQLVDAGATLDLALEIVGLVEAAAS